MLLKVGLIIARCEKMRLAGDAQNHVVVKSGSIQELIRMLCLYKAIHMYSFIKRRGKCIETIDYFAATVKELLALSKIYKVVVIEGLLFPYSAGCLAFKNACSMP